MQEKTAGKSPFHPGEKAVQERLGVRESIEPWARKVVRPYLPEEHRAFFARLPFVVAAARDERGRPWATILAGTPGFLNSPDRGTLEITGSGVADDALHAALVPGAELGLLGIELATRRRNRVNGRIRFRDGERIVFEVDQSFGNCPQYIVERQWQETRTAPDTGARTRHERLTSDHIERIRGADTLFIATGHRGSGTDTRFGMDASHRGGESGFVRVEDDRTLVIPDYSGNNHFNTIGNLVLDARAGLLFVDFESGGFLQLTGRTEIDWDSEDVARFPGARRLIRFTLDEAIQLDRALPIRWEKSMGSLRSLRLIEKTPESRDVTSFLFAASDASLLADFEAGQHLPIELPVAGRRDRVARTYSLSNGAGAEAYRISVKREEHGVASRFLHDDLEVGGEIQASAPSGDFVLDHGTRPVVLISAGIGVTPMLSMLHALVSRRDGRRVLFFHGARDGEHHPFVREVSALAADSDSVTVHVSYSRPRKEDRKGIDYDAEGRVDGALLSSVEPAAPDAEYYLCGPTAFMAELQDSLEKRGIPQARIHTESFGPTG